MSAAPPEPDPLLEACGSGELGLAPDALAKHPHLASWPALAGLAHARPESAETDPADARDTLLAHTGRALAHAEREPAVDPALRLALLFHDVGHADARRAALLDRTGGRTAHDARGSVRARYLLHHTQLSHAERRAVATLVSMHRAPGALAATLEQGSPSRARMLLERLASQGSVRTLHALARCDALALGASRTSAALEAAEYLRLAGEEHGVFEAAPSPWLTADDVKRVAFFDERARDYALAESHRRRLAGDFTVREQAVAFCYSRATHRPADVVVTVGISGSGKSTALEALDATHERLCPDDEREALYGDASEQGNPGEVHAKCIARLKHALRRGARVAYDATNVRYELRARVLRVCHDYGARVALWCFDTPLDVAFARNRARDRVVPEAVIARQAAQFTWPRPWEAHELRVFDEPEPDATPGPR